MITWKHSRLTKSFRAQTWSNIQNGIYPNVANTNRRNHAYRQRQRASIEQHEPISSSLHITCDAICHMRRITVTKPKSVILPDVVSRRMEEDIFQGLSVPDRGLKLAVVSVTVSPLPIRLLPSGGDKIKGSQSSQTPRAKSTQ